MAKRSNRRHVRYEKDQLGCMWGLISMFDFRHGRTTTQRLLSDRRRGNRNAVAMENSGNKLDMLPSSGNNCLGKLVRFGNLTRIQANFDHFYIFIRRAEDGEEIISVTNACKPSVKKLLEEEMSGEQPTKKEINNTNVEAKQCDTGEDDDRRKNRKRKNKTRKRSSGKSLDMDTAEHLVSEGSCQHKSEQQVTGSLVIDNLMEEFYRQIHQKRINCVNNDQPAEAHAQPYQRSSDERLSEAIKFLVSQKLVNRNQVTEDGELQASKEVIDALQILSLDEELFLKLLRDPNSLLVKYVQDLPNAQSKEEESKPHSGTNFSEKELVDSRQSNETVNRKQRTFFRRKLKSHERDLSDENEVSQASNKIVILKPGPTCMQTPETESSLGSSQESQCFMRHREPNEKVGSHFFLAEIKRKLKNAMGREHNRIPRDGFTKRFHGERQNSGDNGGAKEYIGMNSPTKDHFFIERIARPSISVKKGEKKSRLKASDLGAENEINHHSEQRVSNIYIEAKKHLSEMVTNGDENVDTTSRQVTKTLGRILSLPEYNSSPIDSPGRNSEPDIITAQMKFAGFGKFQKVNEINQCNHFGDPSQVAGSAESELCISDNKISNEAQGDNAIPNHFDSCVNGQVAGNAESQLCISDNKFSNEAQGGNGIPNYFVSCVNDDKEDQTSCSTRDEMNAEAPVKATEMMIPEDSKPLGASDMSDAPNIIDDSNVDSCEVSDEKHYHQCLKQDSPEEDQQSISPLGSPSNSSVAKKVECLESTDTQERPSPVSVLEPPFADDVISPASIRSQSAETSIQPHRIRFEEHGSLATNHSNRIKTCMDDKESIFEYVKGVLQASSFNWDELYIRSLSSDQLLDPLLVDEVDYFPNQLCHEQKLLFDCINEVLLEVCAHYFGSPGASFVTPKIRPVPNMKNTIQEVWQGVHWHLLPLPLPCTLDQIVRKDMSKTGTWMDLRLDADNIGVEMGEAILEDLLEDTITSYINESVECE